MDRTILADRELPSEGRCHVHRDEWLDSGGRRPAEDEAGAALVGEVRPGPGEQHHEAVAGADQEEDVDGEPGHPGHEARELEGAEGRDRSRAANSGERSLVVIAEGPERLAPE